MRDELETSPLFPAEKVTPDLTGHEPGDVALRKLQRVAEALNVRDELLLEAKRELHTVATSIQTYLKAVEGAGRPFVEDSAAAMEAKAAKLAQSLDRATTAMDQVVELARQVAGQLSALTEPDLQPMRRRPVPETD